MDRLVRCPRASPENLCKSRVQRRTGYLRTVLTLGRDAAGRVVTVADLNDTDHVDWKVVPERRYRHEFPLQGVLRPSDHLGSAARGRRVRGRQLVRGGLGPIRVNASSSPAERHGTTEDAPRRLTSGDEARIPRSWLR